MNKRADAADPAAISDAAADLKQRALVLLQDAVRTFSRSKLCLRMCRPSASITTGLLSFRKDLITCMHTSSFILRPCDAAGVGYSKTSIRRIASAALSVQRGIGTSAHLCHCGMDPGIAAEPRADDHDVKARQPVLDGSHRLADLLLLPLHHAAC